MIIIYSLNTDDGSGLLRDLVAFYTLAATLLYRKFIDARPLAHTALGHDQQGSALRIHLHADHFIPVSQVHAANTHGASSCASYIPVIETDAHTIFGYHKDIPGIVCGLDLDQFISVLQCHGNDTVLTDICILRLGCLLDHTMFCHHQEILLRIIFLDRNDGRDLLIPVQLQQIYDGHASRCPPCFRYLISPEPVSASFIGKEQDIMQGRGHKQFFDAVIFYGLHPLDPFTASVLGTEIRDAHPLDIAQMRHGDHGILPLDQILIHDLTDSRTDPGPAVIAELHGYDLQFFTDHCQQFLGICKNCLILGDLLHQILIFRFQLLSFQSGELAETHLHDSTCLGIRQSESFGQGDLRRCHIFGAADDLYHFVDIIYGDQKAFYDMSPLLRLVQIIFRTPCYHILLMQDVIFQHIRKAEHLRLVIYQRKHIYTEGILQLRMLVQIIQQNVRITVLTELDHDTHSLTGRLVTKVRNAVHTLILYEVCDLCDQHGLIYHIRQLRHHDPLLSVPHGFDIGNGTDLDLAASRPVGLLYAGASQDLRTCGEIRSLYDLQKLFDLCLPVLIDPVINDLYDRIRNLPKIVRGNIGSHTDSDTGGSVDQQVGIPAGKHHRLLLGLVKVRYEIHRVLVDVGQHFDGHPCQTGFRISHGCGTVSVHGSEIPMSVDQRISGIPLLSQLYQRIVNGTVTMGMIFTHGITDDTCTFTVRLVRSVIQFDHGIQDPSLHGLQSVTNIRKRPGCDHAHRVINI